MNTIKKYWDSVYLFILPLIPSTCLIAGTFWTILKFLGYYPELPWVSFFMFDCSQLVYMSITLYIIHRNRNDSCYIPNHLVQIKCYILAVILIQYCFILHLFPSPTMWECTIIFLLVSVFFFDTRFQIINTVSCIFLLILSYARNPNAFLPPRDPLFAQVLSYQIVVLSVSVCILILITHVVETFLIQQKEDQEIYTRLLKKQLHHYEQANIMDQEIRKFQHDINNHFFCMNTLIQQRKLEELETYFNDLKDSFPETHNIYDSGNTVIDAILNYELSHHLDTSVSVSVTGSLPVLESISSMDLCTVFSNMLTNAITASNDYLSHGESRLNIEFSRGNCYFSIRIQNGSNTPKNSLRVNKMPTKKHGYGLTLIQEVIDKHHGSFEQTWENHMVSTQVILPL